MSIEVTDDGDFDFAGPVYVCKGCDVQLIHKGPEDDCPTVDGRCKQLIDAGWKPVMSRIVLDEPLEIRKKPLCILSRGGWICADCVSRYLPRKKAK